jgi:hypothetical protein
MSATSSTRDFSLARSPKEDTLRLPVPPSSEPVSKAYKPDSIFNAKAFRQVKSSSRYPARSSLPSSPPTHRTERSKPLGRGSSRRELDYPILASPSLCAGTRLRARHRAHPRYAAAVRSNRYNRKRSADACFVLAQHRCPRCRALLPPGPSPHTTRRLATIATRARAFGRAAIRRSCPPYDRNTCEPFVIHAECP